MKKIFSVLIWMLLYNIQIVYAVENEAPQKFSGNVKKDGRAYLLVLEEQGLNYSITYPKVPCKGILDRVSKTDPTKFIQTFFSGRCKNHGIVTLTRQDDDRYYYEWRETRKSPVQTIGYLSPVAIAGTHYAKSLATVKPNPKDLAQRKENSKTRDGKINELDTQPSVAPENDKGKETVDEPVKKTLTELSSAHAETKAIFYKNLDVISLHETDGALICISENVEINDKIKKFATENDITWGYKLTRTSELFDDFYDGLCDAIFEERKNLDDFLKINGGEDGEFLILPETID